METQKSAETSTGTKSEKSLLNEEGQAEGAPDKYSDFKVPEGFTLDTKVADEASTLFKKNGLSQSNAQELVDFYTKHMKSARDELDKAFNSYQDTRQEWRSKINADPEIGGSKLNGVKASISKLINSFGDAKVAEGFRNAMDFTGAGDHPDVVRGLFALSKHFTEGGPVRGSGPSVEGQQAPGQARPSAAQAMYPNLPSSSRTG